jgi:hypothetical protein
MAIEKNGEKERKKEAKNGPNRIGRWCGTYVIL